MHRCLDKSFRAPFYRISRQDQARRLTAARKSLVSHWPALALRSLGRPGAWPLLPSGGFQKSRRWCTSRAFVRSGELSPLAEDLHKHNTLFGVFNVMYVLKRRRWCRKRGVGCCRLQDIYLPYCQHGRCRVGFKSCMRHYIHGVRRTFSFPAHFYECTAHPMACRKHISIR